MGVGGRGGGGNGGGRVVVWSKFRDPGLGEVLWIFSQGPLRAFNTFLILRFPGRGGQITEFPGLIFLFPSLNPFGDTNSQGKCVKKIFSINSPMPSFKTFNHSNFGV